MPLRFGRVVTVTLSIALTGAIIGAVVGAALLLAWASLGFVIAAKGPPAFLLGAAGGAVLGAVLAPIAAWIFLRRVPLGKALLQTTLGTAIGAAIGLALDRAGIRALTWVPAGFAGALAGFVISAVRLWIVTRTSRRSEGMEGSGPVRPA